MTIPVRYDPLAQREEPIGRRVLVYGAALVVTLVVQTLLVGGVTTLRMVTPEQEEPEALVFFEVEEPEPEPEVEEPEPEPEVEEPKPEPEPQSEEPQPVEPEPEPSEATDPEPSPEPEDVRPININLQGESFADGAGGPSFNRGDTVRGGRPDRSSVAEDDRRAAVDGPAATPGTPTGTNEEPTERRRRRVPRDRDASFRAGVSLNDATYPSGARDAGAESVCSYTLEVAPDGSLDRIVAVSCSNDDFDFEGALRTYIASALPRRPFRPAIRGGAEVGTRLSGRHYFEVGNR